MVERTKAEVVEELSCRHSKRESCFSLVRGQVPRYGQKDARMKVVT